MSYFRSVFCTQIDEVWPQVRHFVESVCAKTFNTLDSEEVREHLKNQLMQLMIVVDEHEKPIGVLITEVKTGQRAINIVAVGGDRFEEWVDEGNDLLQKWAASMGAKYVTMVGRRGWAGRKRMFDRLGWKETGVVYLKEV